MIARCAWIVMALAGWSFAALPARRALAQESTNPQAPPAPPAPTASSVQDESLRKLGYADGAFVPSVRDWRHMAARERRALEAFIQQNFPEVWNEVQPLQAGDNRAYNTRMEKLAAELVPIMEEQAENAPRTEILIREKQLEYRIQELVNEFLQNKDEQRRDKIRQKLRELMSKQFDAAQERRRLDISRLEERLLSLKKLMDEKSRNRDGIIERQVEARLNPAGTSDKPERGGTEEGGGQGDGGGKLDGGGKVDSSDKARKSDGEKPDAPHREAPPSEPRP
ncbi:MAG: hypothetical protein HY873_07605 [Chloroflexi bacterium]|nr:hypothetical protein [Chloroflexota bacterium]